MKKKNDEENLKEESGFEEIELEDPEEEEDKTKKKGGWRIHLIIALVMVCIIAYCGYRLWKWDTYGNVTIEEVAAGTYDYESMDYVFSVDPEILAAHGSDGVDDILCIGDYVLTMTSENGDSLVQEMQAIPDSTITVLCAGESQVADTQNAYENNAVTSWQAGNLYDIVYALCSRDYSLQEENAADGEGLTADYVDLLESIDLDNYDTVFLFYSSVDYVKGSVLYDPDDKYDTATYEGAWRAAISTLQTAYPHLKIVVGSPYLHGCISEDNVVPASTISYGNGNLSVFVMRSYNIAMECCVSYEDNYFGLINEETINEYCDIDALNDAGMKLIGQHLVSFFEMKY